MVLTSKVPLPVADMVVPLVAVDPDGTVAVGRRVVANKSAANAKNDLESMVRRV